MGLANRSEGLANKSAGLANRSEGLANRSEGSANRCEGLGAGLALALSIKVRDWGQAGQGRVDKGHVCSGSCTSRSIQGAWVHRGLAVDSPKEPFM